MGAHLLQGSRGHLASEEEQEVDSPWEVGQFGGPTTRVSNRV